MDSTAPYPFPGMNPYFEKQWFEVHPSLIAFSLGHLQRQMPHELRVSIEHGIAITGRYSSEDQDRRPDVSVWRVREDTLTALAPPNYAPPVVRHVVGPKPRHLVIRDRDGELVTVIEFLSPTNKHSGGALAYSQKRLGILNAGVNLVEIDLIRQWGLALALFEDDAMADSIRLENEKLPPHAVTIIRAEAPTQREIYPILYQQPLPACRVPLRPDDTDIWLNLQELAEQCHADGAFDKITDYTAAPEPPLSPEDATWLDEHLKSKNLR